MAHIGVGFGCRPVRHHHVDTLVPGAHKRLVTLKLDTAGDHATAMDFETPEARKVCPVEVWRGVFQERAALHPGDLNGVLKYGANLMMVWDMARRLPGLQDFLSVSVELAEAAPDSGGAGSDDEGSAWTGVSGPTRVAGVCSVPSFLWEQGIVVVGRDGPAGCRAVIGSNEVAFEVGSVCMSVVCLSLRHWLVGVFFQPPCLADSVDRVWSGDTDSPPGPSTKPGTSGDLRAIQLEVDMQRIAMLHAAAALQRLATPMGGVLVVGTRGEFDLGELSVGVMRELVAASRLVLQAQHACFGRHGDMCVAELLLHAFTADGTPEQRAFILTHVTTALGCATQAQAHTDTARAMLGVMTSNGCTVADWVTSVCVELRTRATVLLAVLAPVCADETALSPSHVALVSVLGYANTSKRLSAPLGVAVEALGPLARVAEVAGPWLHAVARSIRHYKPSQLVLPQNWFVLPTTSATHTKPKGTGKPFLQEAIGQALAQMDKLRHRVATVELRSVEPWAGNRVHL